MSEISAVEAVEHITRGGAVVVDMRPQIVRHQGSLPGAIVVEPTDLLTAFGPSSDRKVAGVDFDTEIDIVSVPSQARSIAEQVAGLGYTNVHYVDGGFRALRPLATV